MAPDQERAVKHWQEGAADAFDTAETLFKSKKYHHALFFCHLAVEKALKARYIADNDKLFPYTHELDFLAKELKQSFSKEQMKELEQLNTFNISGRYAEEKDELYKKATPTYAQEWLERTKLILESLAL